MANNKIPTLKWLKVEDVKIPEFRLHSHLQELEDFEESIKADGVIQPIYVFEDENGVYWLADGQNRLETLSKYKPIVPAYVLKGSETDAILHSAKLNVLRGKVNAGELAEFISYLKSTFNWTHEKIASELGFSKAYVSQLLSIAQNPTVLEKLKNELISLKEARNEVLGLHGKPISEEKASFKERSQKQGVSEKPSTFPLMKQPLTDEDLGVTSLKQAMEEGKRFKPLGPEEPEEEENVRKGKCAICNEFFTSKKEIAFILVHKKRCANKLWDLIMKAERESQSDSSQP